MTVAEYRTNGVKIGLILPRLFISDRGLRSGVGVIAPTGAYRPEVPRPQTTKGLVYYKVRKNPKAPHRQISGLEP